MGRWMWWSNQPWDSPYHRTCKLMGQSKLGLGRKHMVNLPLHLRSYWLVQTRAEGTGAIPPFHYVRSRSKEELQVFGSGRSEATSAPPLPCPPTLIGWEFSYCWWKNQWCYISTYLWKKITILQCGPIHVYADLRH